MSNGETGTKPTDEALDDAARQAVRDLRTQITKADPLTMKLLLTDARTHYGWRDEPISDDLLRQVYDIAKMGPTSMNQQPMRLVFVRSAEAKEKLKPTLMDANVPKVMAAPVTAIIANDTAFYENLPKTFPIMEDARGIFSGNEGLAAANAARNGTLQSAWFIIAARSLGLDVGPMSGFDAAKVDEIFLSGTTWKSNFLCNIGYADETKIYRRLPRLDFDDVAKVI